MNSLNLIEQLSNAYGACGFEDQVVEIAEKFAHNGGIYPPIENLLAHMKALAVQNRTVAVMDNGTWAATAGKQIVKQLEEMKNMTVLDQKLSIKSTLKADQEEILDAFAQQIIDAM